MGLLASQPMLVTDLRWLDQVDSTNALLISELAEQAAGPWSIRIATKQAAGRGRQGRSWESPTGSVPISVAVPLTHFEATPSWLSLLTAIALKKALQKYVSDQIKIKWPNDCLISSGKFAGILIERTAHYAVVGIGINFFAAPKIESAAHLGITDYLPALADFLLELNALIQQAAGMTDQQVRDLVTAELSTIGQAVQVQLANSDQVVGIATGITDQGALVIDTDSGLVEVVAGDVIHLRPADAR
jgi:BirA family biotin operon repressor/biotin-[acetyl-CoA-carboxylase] ligase